MKASLSIALMLSAALLSACGSSSSDDEPGPSGPTPNKESFEKFDLSAYEAKTISADTLAGTWVYLETGVGSISVGDSLLNNIKATKKYFVIRSTDTGYESSGCEPGFTSVEVDGNELTTHCDEIGTIIGNTKITGVADGSLAFEMIKISDNIALLGTANYTIAGEGTTTRDVFAFHERKEVITISDGPNAGSYIESAVITGFENAASDYDQIQIYEVTKASIEEQYGLSLMIDESEFHNGYTFLGYVFDDETKVLQVAFPLQGNDTTGFTITSESSFDNSLSFNGSNGSLDVSGTIQIQLPVE